MTYNYDDFKPWLFSDEGQRALLRVRDKAARLLRSWKNLALIQRLEELGDIRAVYVPTVTQHAITALVILKEAVQTLGMDSNHEEEGDETVREVVRLARVFEAELALDVKRGDNHGQGT